MRYRTFAIAFLCCACPILSAQTAVVRAGYQRSLPVVAPGQVITLFVHGLGEPVQEVVAEQAPLPKKLAGFEIAFRQEFVDKTIPLPIFGVAPEPTCPTDAFGPCATSHGAMITVQIPYDIVFATSIFCCRGVLTVIKDGIRRQETLVSLDSTRIHLVNECDTALPRTFRAPRGWHACASPVFDAQGILDPSRPRTRGGDSLTVFAYGLGMLDPRAPLGDSLKEGEMPPRPIPILSPLGVRYHFAANAGPMPGLPPFGGQVNGYTWAGVIPGAVGLYQINLKIPPVPPGTPACGTYIGGESVNSNLTITIRGQISFEGIQICVTP